MPKTGSIEDLGIQKFLDVHYSHVGGFKKFKDLLDKGAPDETIAAKFSTEYRKVVHQTVANWRRKYRREVQA